MNIREFEYIVAIEDEGNISKAARKLGISQPSLSSFLNQEECRLGHKLFHYTKRQMIPTKAGKIYLDFCRQIIETKEQTYHMMFKQQNSLKESFTVGLSPHRGAKLFARIYPKFTSKFPEVDINVKEGYMEDLKNQLLNNQLDFLICTTGEVHFDKFQVITDTKEILKLCVPKFHPMANITKSSKGNLAPVDIRNFSDTPFVMWGDKSTIASILDYFFREIKMTPTKSFESNNINIVDEMISCGVGVGFLPASYCKDSSTRVYFDTSPLLSIYNGICCRKEEELTQAQRYLAYLILTCEQSDSYTKYYNENAKNILKEFGE